MRGEKIPQRLVSKKCFTLILVCFIFFCFQLEKKNDIFFFFFMRNKRGFQVCIYMYCSIFSRRTLRYVRVYCDICCEETFCSLGQGLWNDTVG